MLSDRLLDAERQRDDIVQRLDSHKRAAARAEKDWELERNNLHVSLPGCGPAVMIHTGPLSRPSELYTCAPFALPLHMCSLPPCLMVNKVTALGASGTSTSCGCVSADQRHLGSGVCTLSNNPHCRRPRCSV